MKRALSVAVVAAMAATVLALGGSPASAAVGRTKVVSCKSPQTCWITAFDFTPNGKKIFYVERFSGEIRVFNRMTKTDRRWRKLGNVTSNGEQGLLGLALDPNWPADKWVYVSGTFGSPAKVQVKRIRKAGGTVTTQRLISLPAAGNHNGGVIHFGPDGMLYLVTGDRGNPSLSQFKKNPNGKVLRMTKTGNRPADNPFAGSKAFSYGHRNSFGFAFDPQTGLLWQTENGPECDDEVNLVRKGRNYGWGAGSSCPGTSTEGPNPTQPKRKYNPVIAPTGAAFCAAGCNLGAKNNGALLHGDFNLGQIHRLILKPGRGGVASHTVVYDHPRGILAMIAAPGGKVFFSDSEAIYRLKKV